jgi:hypothetical protein
MYVLFRTRNLGQHFCDISKKNYVNQSLVSLLNDFEVFLVISKKQGNGIIESKVGLYSIFNKGQFTDICQLNVSCGQDSVFGIVHIG